jgi:hypothetical protein
MQKEPLRRTEWLLNPIEKKTRLVMASRCSRCAATTSVTATTTTTASDVATATSAGTDMGSGNPSAVRAAH